MDPAEFQRCLSLDRNNFLSIKSLKQRYIQRSHDGRLGGGEGGGRGGGRGGGGGGGGSGADANFNLWNRRFDEDFETFVKEFPIDDNISECFASSSDDTVRNSDSTVSGDDMQRDQRLKVKSEKDARSKVTEAVCFIEKKITQNRKQKPRIGNNLFRRKDNAEQALRAKKSLSYDDLRQPEDDYLFPLSDTCSLEGGCTGQSARMRNKALFGSQRRCRVLTDSNVNNNRQGQMRPCSTKAANTFTVTADITPNTPTNNNNCNIASNGCSHSGSCSSLNNNSNGVKSGADVECNGNRNSRFHRDSFRRPKVDVGHNASISLGPSIKEKGRQSNMVDCGVWSHPQKGLVTHKILKKALMESPKLKVETNGLALLGDVCMECEDLRMSEKGYTLAHCAAYNGHLQCLQVLVEKAFDLTALDPQGLRPSQVALSAGHIDCWNYLAVFELSHILLREMCNFGSLVERVNNQLESVRSEAEMLRHTLESRSHDLRNQMQSVREVTRSIQRSLDPHHPHSHHHHHHHHRHQQSSKHQCPGQQGPTYQVIQESLTLLERVECDLAELCRVDSDGGSSRKSCPEGSLEWILKQIEKLEMDDSHINDIRQLENVEKRCRVIRNFLLLEDDQQNASGWREDYHDGMSTSSMQSSVSSSSSSNSVSSSTRLRRVPRRGQPSVSCASSPSSRTRAAQHGDPRLKMSEEQLRHTLPRRRQQPQQPQQQQKPQEQHQQLPQRWLHQQWHQHQQQSPSRQNARRPVSYSKQPGHRSDEASRMLGPPLSGRGLVLASSVTDTTDMESSSDWESSSQESMESSMNARSEGSVPYVKSKPSTSSSWNFVPPKSGERINLLDVDARVHGKYLPHRSSVDRLTDMESELASTSANMQDSPGSLRQERLANHFRYLEKNTKMRDEDLRGGVTAVEKHGPNTKNYQAGDTHSNCQPNSKNENGNGCQNLSEGDFEMASHASATLSETAGRTFQKGPNSAPSTSRPDHEFRGWAHNANRPLKRNDSFQSNANIQRKDFIGRCRQTIDDEGLPFNQSFSLGGSQTSNKPWYDVSDDDTSVYTSTYGIVGYDSESSFYT
ncbi:uncharacterized protein LOC115227425 [Octopus sinensis]|uniref:Uncharacterized protein LOC115227425 n=1 Tax=Octopus sinensis TaxID=2607531 RepID=A0A7E6EI09_9MOLL|nr:uncharacterized protein LOC115227425 [Octopus sinensis]